MFINFRIFLLALASGFQPPWSLPSICRKPTKSSSSRLLHLACSQGDFRHPIGEILVRNPERSPVTGCHRILENLETDHLQSQNRSVRSPYPPELAGWGTGDLNLTLQAEVEGEISSCWRLPNLRGRIPWQRRGGFQDLGTLWSLVILQWFQAQDWPEHARIWC